MSSLLPLLLLLATGTTPEAAPRATVPAEEVLHAALRALAIRADAAKIEAEFSVAGKIGEVVVPAGKKVEGVSAEASDTWLRPRTAVPVRIRYTDGSKTSVMVWFAVTAPIEGLVYAAAAPKSTAGESVVFTTGPIDLARTHGAELVSADALAGRRLRKAASAGTPALAADFEPMPAVQAQQTVRIDASTAGLKLSIKGRALNDGAIGELISVLPSNATQPVRARVDSSQVVILEN